MNTGDDLDLDLSGADVADVPTENKQKSFWESVGSAEARTYERGGDLPEGDYLVKIRACKKLSPVNSCDAFLCEFDVVESSNKDCPVGFFGRWYQRLDKKIIYEGQLKKFVSAVLGVDLSSDRGQKIFDAKILPKMREIGDKLISAENFFGGKTVRIQARRGSPNEKTGKSYVNLHFLPPRAPGA